MLKIKKIFRKLGAILKSSLIISDILKFQTVNDGRFPLRLRHLMPRLGDKTSQTDFDLHYIYHPAWAARIIAANQPAEHIDISSSLPFSTILSAFIKTKFYDYRPAHLELSNFSSEAADLTALPFADNSILSLSCLHTVEHIGLGRYGDKIDSRGDLKAIKELTRVLAPGGSLLFAVPVGQPRLMFNAHRIYSYEQILAYFSELELKEFTLISENNKKMITNANPALAAQEKYGCGCFWFIKNK